MTNDSIPSKCKDCPHARENPYTKGQYCGMSVAPLGSKCADNFCVRPRAGDGQTVASNPATAPATGQGNASPGGVAESNPSPQEPPEATDGDHPKQAVEYDQLEDGTVIGYPYQAI